jgi:hypothetical protein
MIKDPENWGSPEPQTSRVHPQDISTNSEGFYKPSKLRSRIEQSEKSDFSRKEMNLIPTFEGEASPTAREKD